MGLIVGPVVAAVLGRDVDSKSEDEQSNDSLNGFVWIKFRGC